MPTARPTNFVNVAARVFDTPLLIEQRKLDAILRVLGPRMGFGTSDDAIAGPGYRTPDEHVEAFRSMLGPKAASSRVARAEWHDEGYISVGRLGVVPIVGTLIQRSDWMAESSGMMSYQRIERAFAAAMNDDEVEEVILEIDSPGGEVAGAFDLADRIHEAGQDKRIVAVASEFAASAAYLIASAAAEIVVPRTGAVGSVGVVAAHTDFSGAMEKRGIAVTYVYAGDKKIDGNPYMPLSDSARADWQADIDKIYGLFVETVARNRGLSTAQVRDTQAGLFMGQTAVANRLADRVNTYAGEISNGLTRPGGTLRLLNSPEKEALMSQNKGGASNTSAATNTNAPATAPAPGSTAPGSETAAAQAPGASVSTGASAADERTRIKSILTHAESKGRETLANHLAYETDLSVEQCVGMLKASPKAADSAAPASTGNSPGELRTAMARQGSPGITADERPTGADAGGGQGGNVVQLDTQKIYKNRNAGARDRMQRFTTGVPRGK